MGFYEEWQKKSKEYKPKSVDQGVLWLKQMALMSPHFKDLRDAPNPISFSELWINAFGQMCYDLGLNRIDENSYERGYNDAMLSVATKLGMEYEP